MLRPTASVKSLFLAALLLPASALALVGDEETQYFPEARTARLIPGIY